MEHIRTISRKLLSDLRDNNKSLILSPDLERKINLVKSEYGSLDQFLVEFNPDAQVTIVEARNDLWISGDFPTLALINQTYGQTSSAQWLIAQLFNLSEFSGCKDKFTDEQIYECARVIVANYYYLKITELMKFFFEMKSGKYGKFYGALDPMVVTTSLREFVHDRNFKLQQIENEERRARDEEARKHAITYEEYLRNKQQGLYETQKQN